MERVRWINVFDPEELVTKNLVRKGDRVKITGYFRTRRSRRSVVARRAGSDSEKAAWQLAQPDLGGGDQISRVQRRCSRGGLEPESPILPGPGRAGRAGRASPLVAGRPSGRVAPCQITDELSNTT